jgi:histidyl-tRNA synthetase
MKAQMKSADRSGAALCIIVGDDERLAQSVIIRTMEGGSQQTVSRADLVSHVTRMLGH